MATDLKISLLKLSSFKVFNLKLSLRRISAHENRQNGQILIESLASVILILGSFNFTFYLIVFFWMKLWSEHNLYESLICRESRQSHQSCKQFFMSNFKKGQFLFKVKNIVWKKSAGLQSATINVQDVTGRQYQFTRKLTVNGVRL